MSELVHKSPGGALRVLRSGETFTKPDGSRISVESLQRASTQELAGVSVLRVPPPAPPAGMVLQSLTYRATADGVEAVPVFVPIPPKRWSPNLILRAVERIDPAKARALLTNMAELPKAKFLTAPGISEDDAALATMISALSITKAELKAAIIAVEKA